MIHLAALAAASQAAHSSGAGILDPIAKPIAGALAAFYALVPNYGVAIILLSIVWMIIISPLTLKTTRSMLAMQKLQPQLKKLQEQHRNDRQAFAQAQMELFREHNVSPFGSCLPSILPLPVFIALFRVINGLSHHSGVVATPKYLSVHTQMHNDIVKAHGHLNAFGLDLSSNALAAHSTFFTALPFYILLLAMMGTQYYQTVQMMSRNPAAQQNSQARLMKFLPLIFGVFCARFPAGVVLYYAMSNVCRIAQQAAMYRFDPKVKALAAQEVLEVEAKTREIDNRKADRGSRPGTSAPPADAPRSRFRELLAGAMEQQSETRGTRGRPALPPGKTSPAPPATGRSTNKSGEAANPTRPVSTSGPKNPPPAPKAASGDGQSTAKGNGTEAGGNGSRPGRPGASPVGQAAGGPPGRRGTPGAPSRSGPKGSGGAPGGSRAGNQGRRTNKKRRGR